MVLQTSRNLFIPGTVDCGMVCLDRQWITRLITEYGDRQQLQGRYDVSLTDLCPTEPLTGIHNHDMRVTLGWVGGLLLLCGDKRALRNI